MNPTKRIPNPKNNQAQASPWQLYPSKRLTGKFYYFNVSTGETAWSFSNTDKNVKKGPIHRVTDKSHTYPEPFDPPIDDITNTTYSFSSVKNTGNTDFSHSKTVRPSPVFSQAVFPKYVQTEMLSSKYVWALTPMYVPSQMPPHWQTINQTTQAYEAEQPMFMPSHMPFLSQFQPLKRPTFMPGTFQYRNSTPIQTYKEAPMFDQASNFNTFKMSQVAQTLGKPFTKDEACQTFAPTSKLKDTQSESDSTTKSVYKSRSAEKFSTLFKDVEVGDWQTMNQTTQAYEAEQPMFMPSHMPFHNQFKPLKRPTFMPGTFQYRNSTPFQTYKEATMFDQASNFNTFKMSQAAQTLGKPFTKDEACQIFAPTSKLKHTQSESDSTTKSVSKSRSAKKISTLFKDVEVGDWQTMNQTTQAYEAEQPMFMQPSHMPFHNQFKPLKRPTFMPGTFQYRNSTPIQTYKEAPMFDQASNLNTFKMSQAAQTLGKPFKKDEACQTFAPTSKLKHTQSESDSTTKSVYKSRSAEKISTLFKDVEVGDWQTMNQTTQAYEAEQPMFMPSHMPFHNQFKPLKRPTFMPGTFQYRNSTPFQTYKEATMFDQASNFNTFKMSQAAQTLGKPFTKDEACQIFAPTSKLKHTQSESDSTTKSVSKSRSAKKISTLFKDVEVGDWQTMNQTTQAYEAEQSMFMQPSHMPFHNQFKPLKRPTFMPGTFQYRNSTPIQTYKEAPMFDQASNLNTFKMSQAAQTLGKPFTKDEACQTFAPTSKLKHTQSESDSTTKSVYKSRSAEKFSTLFKDVETSTLIPPDKVDNVSKKCRWS